MKAQRRNRWGANHKRSDNLTWKEWRATVEMIYEPERMSMNERLIEVLKKRETKMSAANTAEKTAETIVQEGPSYADYVNAAMALLEYEPELEEVLSSTQFAIDHCDFIESECITMSGETYSGIDLDVSVELSVGGSSEIYLSEQNDICAENVETIITSMLSCIERPHNWTEEGAPKAEELMMHVCAKALNMEHMLRVTAEGDEYIHAFPTADGNPFIVKELSETETQVPGLAFELRLNGDMSVKHLSTEMRLAESLIELHKNEAMNIENLCEFVLDFIRSEKGGE